MLPASQRGALTSTFSGGNVKGRARGVHKIIASPHARIPRLFVRVPSNDKQALPPRSNASNRAGSGWVQTGIGLLPYPDNGVGQSSSSHPRPERQASMSSCCAWTLRRAAIVVLDAAEHWQRDYLA